MVFRVLHVQTLPEPVDPALISLKACGLLHHINHVIVLKNVFGRVGIYPAALQTDRPDAVILLCGGQDEVQHFPFGSHRTVFRRVPMPSIQHSISSPG